MANRIETEFPAGVLALQQKSAYPMGESTRVTVESAPAAELELRFFTPSYLPPDEILVNGGKIDSTPFLPHELRPNPFFTAFLPEANS